MKPSPPGWPRLSSGVVYKDCAAMIDWLCNALAFELRIRVDDDKGQPIHCELTYGEALIMLASESDAKRFGIPMKSPLTAGANTQTLMLYVDDVDAHCAHARACGAQIIDEPSDRDYGEEHWTDRSYGLLDPEQHLWWFAQRLRTGPGQD
jgi:uncharacterized glyoxalase superfamily protein PhnB